MEAKSYYLVAVELLLAFCGVIFFLFRKSSRRCILSKADIYVVLLALMSTFWFALGATNGRWLSLKATIFVCCLYLSSKFPRQGMLLLATLALTGYFLDDIANGVLFSKQIGANADQIMTIPFVLIISALFLYKRAKHINIWSLYFVASLQILVAVIIHARGDALSAILLILLVSSKKVSQIFLKIVQWIPFIYIAIMLISYNALIFNIKVISATPSNIERSSMIFAAMDHFFDYPFTGPRVEFDKFVTSAMGAINCSHISTTGGGINGLGIPGKGIPGKGITGLGIPGLGIPGKDITAGEGHAFLCKPYYNAKGVDPHSFILSLWRDEGAMLTILWLFPWFYYWHTLKSLKPQLDETRIRIVIGLLAISVVEFSLSPPSTGIRLMVALIMGAALGFVSERSLFNNRHT